MFAHHQNLEKEIKVMTEKLESKNTQIEGLEAEFSEQMEELMSKQSSLDEAEEGKKNLEQRTRC